MQDAPESAEAPRRGQRECETTIATNDDNIGWMRGILVSEERSNRSDVGLTLKSRHIQEFSIQLDGPICGTLQCLAETALPLNIRWQQPRGGEQQENIARLPGCDRRCGDGGK
jgi:hypothetical protein